MQPSPVANMSAEPPSPVPRPALRLVPCHAPAEPNLYLIRHGQTSGNGQRYIGHEDLKLDAIGRAEARVLSQELATCPFDRLYCSPLLRARQTAEPILRDRHDSAGEPLLALVRPDLMEINYGHFQGLLKQDHALALKRVHLHQRMPGGESLADVYTRVSRFAAELRREFALGRRVAVVGHYWSNRLLRGALLGATLEATLAMSDYKPANGSCLTMSCCHDLPGHDAGQDRLGGTVDANGLASNGDLRESDA